MGRWTAGLGNQSISVSQEQLAHFRALYVPDRTLAARMSELFVFDMYVLGHAYGISPFEILQAVTHLERGEPPGGIKPATRFDYPPLMGFWHKHYFAAPFIPHNILTALGKRGMRRVLEETMCSSDSPVITNEMISELARRIANEPLEKRHREGALTGEWIVFVKHDGRPYYLCLTTHKAGDQEVHDRIMQHCRADFPDLLDWKEAAAALNETRQANSV